MEELDKEQIRLLRRRRQSFWQDRSWWPSREQFAYLSRYFFQRRVALTVWATVFLVLQAFLEIALIFISHRYLSGGSYFISQFNLLLVIIVSAILYLTAAFIAIKSERTLVIWLINNLRLKWYQRSLAQNQERSNLADKGLLLTKISYHLPLFATGLSNSLLGLARWLLLVFILIFLIFIFGVQFIWLALLALLISFIVAGAAFYVSKNYVSREVTFYSRLIKLVDFSLSDWQFTKIFSQESNNIKDFNRLVVLDSHARIRRNLWLRFSGSVLFIFLLLLGWAFGALNEQVVAIFTAGSPMAKYTVIIFTIYFSRLLYEALRVGLYSVPFILGLELSVPPAGTYKFSAKTPAPWSKLEFHSAKTRFFLKGAYYRNLNFSFQRGQRYIILGAAQSGKSHLARLLVGRGAYGRRTWIIKADGRRFFYNDLFNKYSGFYFLDPDFNSSRSLLEFISGRDKTLISDQDFTRISELVNARPQWQALFFEKSDWRLAANKFLTNSKNRLLLQALHCLVNPPYLISVDNFWLDSGNPDLVEILNLLQQDLPNTIFVFFAKTKPLGLDYQHSYEI